MFYINIASALICLSRTESIEGGGSGVRPEQVDYLIDKDGEIPFLLLEKLC
jgi:hypothetical protein